MEIERKWLVAGWPEGAVPSHTCRMDQGYIALSPTVRIRREAEGRDGPPRSCASRERRTPPAWPGRKLRRRSPRDLFSRLEGADRPAPDPKGAAALSPGGRSGAGGQPGGPGGAGLLLLRRGGGSPPGRPPWPGSRASGPDTCPGRSRDSPGRSMAAYWLATRGHAGGVDAPSGLKNKG